jgi:SagB-type dehydrogenase family enzyme
MTKTIGEMFMEQTRPEALEPSEQERRMPQPPLELAYTGPGPRIELPRPEEIDLGGSDLRQVIEQRRTRRQYADTPLGLDELSYLLWLTQGIQAVNARPATQRTVPSAGARHAFETLLLVNRVKAVKPGLYRYLAGEHALGGLDFSDALQATIMQACLNQRQIAGSAVTFIWEAVTARMRWRYGQRGYRYLHLDAGHVCQNLCLAAESIGCCVCPMAAFDDAALNAALGLDGSEQFVIYMGAVGKKLADA